MNNLFAAAVSAMLAGAINAPISQVRADPDISASAHSASYPAEWKSFISAAQLTREIDAGKDLTIIDVRDEEQYFAGHIPGAVNIPGVQWRTPKARPGVGIGDTVFRTPAGLPDLTRYEYLLSKSGITRDDDIVVVGNFAGKADSTVPVVILRWLGAERVRYVDGVAKEDWTALGRSLSDIPVLLPSSRFVAQPSSGVIWTLDDVVGNLGRQDVVFWDCRTEQEWNGTDLRGNKRGGRIPGAVWLDSQSLIDQYTRNIISREQTLELLAQRGITPDKTIVIYCQTGTRCTLPVIQLQDLGFEKVALYDGSWIEYGNRSDTPVEAETSGS